MRDSSDYVCFEMDDLRSEVLDFGKRARAAARARTDKLHARGPMALEELTTYKYIIRGDGQIRE